MKSPGHPVLSRTRKRNEAASMIEDAVNVGSLLGAEHIIARPVGGREKGPLAMSAGTLTP
jgi:hypothetical protein